MFLQASLPIQFTTFKSLFTSNVQIQGTLPLLNCSLFTLSVQLCSLCHFPTVCLTHWVFRFQLFCHFSTATLSHWVSRSWSRHQKIMCTRSQLVLLQLIYLKCIVDFIVLLFLFGTGCVDGSGSLSGGAFNQLKLVTLNLV